MMYPGCGWEWSKGGVNSSTRSSSARSSSPVDDCMACKARAGSAAPDSTAQDCASESIRISELARDPIGDPSSKKARTYHSPSQHECSSARAVSYTHLTLPTIYSV